MSFFELTLTNMKYSLILSFTTNYAINEKNKVLVFSWSFSDEKRGSWRQFTLIGLKGVGDFYYSIISKWFGVERPSVRSSMYHGWELFKS